MPDEVISCVTVIVKRRTKTGGNQSADISRINRRVQSGAACQADAVETMRNPQSKRADCCVYST
jgi:hypothetical protein